MIDKILLKLFGYIDDFTTIMENLLFPKPKKKQKKKKKCKNCHCNCHCSGDLHADKYGVCTCDNCKCKN